MRSHHIALYRKVAYYRFQNRCFPSCRALFLFVRINCFTSYALQRGKRQLNATLCNENGKRRKKKHGTP